MMWCKSCGAFQFTRQHVGTMGSKSLTLDIYNCTSCRTTYSIRQSKPKIALKLVFIAFLALFFIGCSGPSPYAYLECSFYQDMDHWFEIHEGMEIQVLSSDGRQAVIYPDEMTETEVYQTLGLMAPKCLKHQFNSCGQTAVNTIVLTCQD